MERGNKDIELHTFLWFLSLGHQVAPTFNVRKNLKINSLDLYSMLGLSIDRKLPISVKYSVLRSKLKGKNNFLLSFQLVNLSQGSDTI